MIPYILIFSIVILLMLFSELLLRKGWKKISIIIGTISIIVLSYFMGIRAETIGTDILVYVKPYYEYIHNNGLFLFLEKTNCEFLYAFFTYCIVLVKGDLKLLLFFISVINTIILYKFSLENREKASITLTFIVYLFMLYGLSLNLVRQFFAMIIVLYSIKYIKEKQALKYTLGVLIATGFHSTAITMLILYPLYIIFDTKYENLVKFLVILAVCAITIFIRELIPFILSLNILPVKFNYEYISRYFINGYSINITYTVIKVLVLFIVLLCMKNIKKYEPEDKEKKFYNFMAYIMILDICLFQFGAVIAFAERYSYYLMTISYLFLIPQLKKGFGKTAKNQLLGIFLTIIVSVLYWYVVYGYLGISSIIPYEIGH